MLRRDIPAEPLIMNDHTRMSRMLRPSEGGADPGICLCAKLPLTRKKSNTTPMWIHIASINEEHIPVLEAQDLNFLAFLRYLRTRSDVQATQTKEMF